MSSVALRRKGSLNSFLTPSNKSSIAQSAAPTVITTTNTMNSPTLSHDLLESVQAEAAGDDKSTNDVLTSKFYRVLPCSNKPEETGFRQEQYDLQHYCDRLYDNDPTLIELNVYDKKIGDTGATELAKALRTNSSLRKLDLGYKQITDEGATELALALWANQTLEVLGIWDSALSDAGAQAIAQAVESENASLKVLSLWGNYIGDEGVMALARALESNTLEKLRLNNNDFIGNAGVEALARALQTNSSLVDLDVEHCQIGDEGAKALAKALKTNTTLEKLCIGGNQITDSGAKDLLDALLYHNRTVKEFYIYGNYISPLLMHRLAAVMKRNESGAVVAPPQSPSTTPINKTLKHVDSDDLLEYHEALSETYESVDESASSEEFEECYV